ncbi:MAG TPA: UTP--glucose-1-phosphate uridylyltransferase GalU [Acidimicrobiia bacterium]|nr:UTP--glucose-1-phosphate uridylyltransferase GalU [Acidimicrobiia bacterium]
MTTPVRKVVIPAAGLGTRFLPVTKNQPKEMLPVVDKPSIQYVVEEAVRAGLRDVLVITGRGKGAIEDHFDRNVELETYLEARHKDEMLREVQATSNLAELHYIRQRDALGLGHAVSVARDHVGNESFAVMLGDDIMVDDAQLLRRMLAVQAARGGAVLALMEVSPAEISAYGSAAVEPIEPGLARVHGLVEKPAPAEAPSNLAVIGRYVFPPAIFDALARTKPGVGGELQLTDGVANLLDREPVHGVVFSEGRYDIGQRLDYLRANIELALARPDLGPDLGALLADLVRRRNLG